jgi:hypothetical protein
MGPGIGGKRGMARILDDDTAAGMPFGPDLVAGAANRQTEDIQPRPDVAYGTRGKHMDLCGHRGIVYFRRSPGQSTMWFRVSGSL